MRGFLLIAILLGIPVLSSAADTQLSGNWILDVAQSEFGHATRPTKATVAYTVRGDVVTATRIDDVAGGQQKTQMTWYLDGLQHPSQRPAPGSSVTHWKHHTFINERSSKDGLYKETITVTLSSDGKIATEILDTKTPEGGNHEKLIWKRVER